MRHQNPIIRKRNQYGGSSVEYMAVLAAVVIPLVIVVVPLAMHMIVFYSHRIWAAAGSVLGFSGF